MPCLNVMWFAGTAYIHGLQFVEGNFVILMDADLSHHVSLPWLSKMITPIDHAQCIAAYEQPEF
jgi:hypothetical protein